jgi:hypothetical protein
MTWDQLKALDREGLVSVECHTVTHPEDLRECGDEQLHTELVESKRVLEEKLGRKMRFLAYPVGNADSRVAKVARDAGYEMCLTMGPGRGGSPADPYFVPRFMPNNQPQVRGGVESEEEPLTTSNVIDLAPADLESGYLEDGQVRMRWVRGGRLSGIRLNGRRHVPDIVRATNAVAGLNGTFFSDSLVASTGAAMVGPVLNRFGPGFSPGLDSDREKLAGRPLVLISPEKIAFLPFRPRLALDREGVERLLPGATDCLVAGPWLVHRGRPLTREEMETFRLRDAFDFRPRAFFGVDKEGRAFLGASSTGNMSDRLAVSIAKLGLEECVLLDSGFSTSLVIGREVLVSGIRQTRFPARPVPHALVIHPVDPQTGGEIMVVDRDPNWSGPVETPSMEQVQAVLAEGELGIEEEPEADEEPEGGRRRRR